MAGLRPDRRAKAGRGGARTGGDPHRQAPWVWTRPPCRSSMRAWTTDRAWRSASRRPVRHVAITVRRFGKRSFSAAQLVEQGALPEHIRARGRADPPHPPQHPRERRHRQRQDDAAQCPSLNSLPDDERIVAIEDTLELRIDSLNCVRFEARGLQDGAVTIRDLVKSRPPPPARSHRRRRGARGGSRRPVASPQHRPRRLAHHRSRQQRRKRALALGELRHAGRRRSPVGCHMPGRPWTASQW